MQRHTEYLRRYPITKGMSDQDLDELHQVLQVCEAPKDHEIFIEGEVTTGLVFVRKGSIVVLKRGPDGKNHRILQASAPTVVGELEIFDALPSSATVVSTTPLIYSLLTHDAYERWLDIHPASQSKLHRNIARILARRLYATNQELVRLLDPKHYTEFEQAWQSIHGDRN